MQVVVKRSALVEALGKIIGENRTGESGRIDIIMRDAAEGDEPIKPVEQMATQLSTELPDVSDPDFIPVNIEELSKSAYVIADAVPPGEIEWFYRKLHEILDDALDRDSDVPEEEEGIQAEVNESVVRKMLSILLEQTESDVRLMKQAAQKIRSGADWVEVARELSLNPQFSSEDEDEILMTLASVVTGISDEDETVSQMPAQESEPLSTPEPTEVDDESGEESPEMGPEYYQATALDDVIQALISKEKHLVPLMDPSTGSVATTPVLKIAEDGSLSLSKEPMKVLASKRAVIQLVDEALRDSDTRRKFDKYVKEIGNEDHAMIGLRLEFMRWLGEEGDPITNYIAAIMAANNIADIRSKSMGVPKYGPEISEDLMAMAEFAEKDGSDVEAKSGRGKDMVIRKVTAQEMADALREIADERIEKPGKSKRTTYDMDAVPTAEELAEIESANELEQIKRNMKNLTKNAPLYGYSAASGLRQWVNKFPLMAYTVLMGEEKGASAFQGYRDLLMGYMNSLLDNFIDAVIPSAIEGINNSLKDPNISEEERAEDNRWIELLETLNSEFEEMRQSALSTDEEEIDVDLLLGNLSYERVGNLILRNATNILFKEEDLRLVSKYIEDELIKHLISQGMSKKAATKLSHMFNGRVAMVNYDELKKADRGERVSTRTQNVKDLGIGVAEYTNAQRKASQILTSWFSEDEARKRRKIEAMAKAKGEEVSRHVRDKLKDEVRGKLVGVTDDDKKEKARKISLADILEDAIDKTASDLELDIELLKMRLPPSEKTPEKLAEEKITKIISRMI